MGKGKIMDYSMASAFVDYGGADVYFGWKETNYSGQEAGYILLQGLFQGKSVDEMFSSMKKIKEKDRTIHYQSSGDGDIEAEEGDGDDLTEDNFFECIKKDKQKKCIERAATMTTATLHYYPATASDFRLADIPPRVNTVGHSDLTRTGVTLHGEIVSDGGLPVTEIGFLISTDPDGSDYKQIVVEHSVGTNYPEPFEVNCTGLTPKTPYYYKAYAVNADGMAVGEIKAFTTLDDQGITEEINKIVPKEIQDGMQDLGLPVYGGGTPPSIAGTYKIAPLVLKKSNFWDSYSAGHRFNDMYITFSEQNNSDLTVKVVTNQENVTGEGTGAYIVGEGDKFTVFVEVTSYKNGKFRAKTAEIYSGILTSTGIKNLYYALVMLDDSGDPGEVIEVGQGRLFYDSDGFSEKVNSVTRSASGDTELLPSNISSKKQ
ncbi:MAG: hypothetical protein LBB90_03240 [Tannerella sp.]|nr:hypothetical protein [Tannerella sp.]